MRIVFAIILISYFVIIFVESLVSLIKCLRSRKLAQKEQAIIDECAKLQSSRDWKNLED